MIRYTFAAAALLAAASAIAQDEPRFCPNRPDLGSSACTVEPGRVLAEVSAADWELDDGPDTRIDTLRKGLPAGLEELAQLGRTLWRRRADILAYFDLGASNGPVEAINGRLEHLRGIALGFRNLDHYILRSLIHSGQLQDRINAL